MKKQLSILGIFTAFLFSACSSDSNSSREEKIKGQWKLVRVSGSIVGFVHDFEPGKIIWNFDSTTNRVTIVNNNTNDELTDFFDSGVYSFQIDNRSNPEICSESLEINNLDLGCVSVSNDTLNIDQAYTDGYILMLVR